MVRKKRKKRKKTTTRKTTKRRGRKRKRHPTHLIVTKKDKVTGLALEGYYYKAGKKIKWSRIRDMKRKAKKTVRRKEDLWRGDLPGQSV